MRWALILLAVLLVGCGNGGSGKKPQTISTVSAAPPTKFVTGEAIPLESEVELTLLCGYTKGSYDKLYPMPEGEIRLADLQLFVRPVYCVAVATVDDVRSPFSNEIRFTCPRPGNCRE